jgi:hypothetical protein
VAVPGASSYADVEATSSQQLADWIASYVIHGSCAGVIHLRRLRSAIKLACRYEPEATSTYETWLRGYGTAYKLRDKAAVEASVLLERHGGDLLDFRRRQPWAPGRSQFRTTCVGACRRTAATYLRFAPHETLRYVRICNTLRTSQHGAYSQTRLRRHTAIQF